MGIFFTGLCIGLCLCFAGGITLLRTAYGRILENDFSDRPDNPVNLLFNTMVSKQDQILSHLYVAYGFFISSAMILVTHYLLDSLNYWQIAMHCILLPFFFVLLTNFLPKAYMLQQPVDFSLSLLPWVNIISKIFAAPAFVLTFLGKAITSPAKTAFQSLDNLINTFEFYPLVTRFYRSEAIIDTPEKKDYLIQQSLGRFASMAVSQMMIPVKRLKRMDAALEIEELLSQSFNTNARRILLYQDSLEDIIGILHVSLLMKSFCLAEGDKDTTDITSAISEPVFIPSEKSVLAQLQDFAGQQTQFALIRDQNNFICGAIDLETILEALASDLRQKAV